MHVSQGGRRSGHLQLQAQGPSSNVATSPQSSAATEKTGPNASHPHQLLPDQTYLCSACGEPGTHSPEYSHRSSRPDPKGEEDPALARPPDPGSAGLSPPSDHKPWQGNSPSSRGHHGRSKEARVCPANDATLLRELSIVCNTSILHSDGRKV